MLAAFINCFKVPELRARLLFTFGMVFIARLGANIPLPGINPAPLQDYYQSLNSSTGSLVGLYNLFTGGALLKGAVFALGIMPYISASIILQLLGAVMPSLARLQQEGEIGRQKITQYTRYLTIAIGLIQSTLLVLALTNYPDKLFPGYDVGQWGNVVIIDKDTFVFTSVIFLTAGTMILMWLGEQITQRGVGNGISILITIGILADLPSAAVFAWQLITAPVGAEVQLQWYQATLLLGLMVVVVVGIIAMVQATRKIPIQYAKRIVGRRVMGGQNSFLPLKVNYAGVMPVIFASAILIFPQQIAAYLAGATGSSGFQSFAFLFSPGHWFYYLFYGTLVLAFSYFWVSIMFKPVQIADDLKKSGGYVPGIRPGGPTAAFLDFVMTRLTLAGAIFLTLIAVMPIVLAQAYNIPFQVSQFFGGTGTLIAVGVVLETLRQIETHLLQRHYDGFLKKSKARNKRGQQLGELSSELRGLNLGLLWLVCGGLFLVGFIAWILRSFVW